MCNAIISNKSAENSENKFLALHILFDFGDIPEPPNGRQNSWSYQQQFFLFVLSPHLFALHVYYDDEFRLGWICVTLFRVSWRMS